MSGPVPRRRHGTPRQAGPTHSRQPPAPSPDELVEDTIVVGMRWGRGDEVPDSDDWMEPFSEKFGGWALFWQTGFINFEGVSACIMVLLV
jgi:hypothetical protein